MGVGTGAQTYKTAVQIGRAAHFDAGSSAASQRCADMPHTTNYNPKDGFINLSPAQQVWAPMLQKHPPAAGGGGFGLQNQSEPTPIARDPSTEFGLRINLSPPACRGGGLGFRINMNIPRKSPSEGSLRHSRNSAPPYCYAERILGSPFG